MKFECPACAQHLDGEEAYIGRTVNCPACGRAFVVAQPVVPASAVLLKAASASPAPPNRPAAPARPAPAKAARTSKLAIVSLALSAGSFVLGPFGFIPGIICGHLARGKIRRDSTLAGKGLATAGLAVGYCFVLLSVAAVAIFAVFARNLARQVAQNAQMTAGAQPSPTARRPRPEGNSPADASSAADAGTAADTASAGNRDYSMISTQDPFIPSQPAAGPIQGSQFYVRRARIDDSDLVLIGDATKDLPEIRLHPQAGAQNRFQFNVVPLAVNAARFSMATQIQPNGTLGKSCTVTLRTSEGSTDLSTDAGIRLVFHAPQNGACKTAIHLAFGPSTKDYLVGEFTTELPPEVIEKVKGIKSGFKLPDLGRNRPNP